MLVSRLSVIFSSSPELTANGSCCAGRTRSRRIQMIATLYSQRLLLKPLMRLDQVVSKANNKVVFLLYASLVLHRFPPGFHPWASFLFFLFSLLSYLFLFDPVSPSLQRMISSIRSVFVSSLLLFIENIGKVLRLIKQKRFHWVPRNR